MFKANPKLKRIFFLGFLLSIHLALVAYINSSFLATFLSEKDVGLLYVIGSIISVIVLLLIPKILTTWGEYKFLIYTAALDALLLLALSMAKNTSTIILLFILYVTFNNIIIFLLDELVQIFSRNSSMGRVRGYYLTTINLAWVLTQGVYGKILGTSSFSTLYFIGFCIMALFFLIALVYFKKLRDPEYDKVNPRASLRKFFQNKNLARSYKINFLLQFFFAIMVIYTPIYLSAHLHFTWTEIGTIFTIMLLPFVLIQGQLGKYSDRVGERGMLMFGFLIAAAATILLFFIHLHAVWIWALLLFTTRIGAAIVEVMSDVYFFRHIKDENDEFIGIYRNTAPASYVFAPLFAFLFFSYTPAFNFIFLILGAIMLYGVYLSSGISKRDI